MATKKKATAPQTEPSIRLKYCEALAIIAGHQHFPGFVDNVIGHSSCVRYDDVETLHERFEQLWSRVSPKSFAKMVEAFYTLAGRPELGEDDNDDTVLLQRMAKPAEFYVRLWADFGKTKTSADVESVFALLFEKRVGA